MNSPLAASSVSGATTAPENVRGAWKANSPAIWSTRAELVATNAPQPRPSSSSERGSGS